MQKASRRALHVLAVTSMVGVCGAIAACSSFGDAGSSSGGSSGGDAATPGDGTTGAEDADDGGCGAALESLQSYAEPGTSVTSLAADATNLWFTVATAVYRKNDKEAAIITSGLSDYGALGLTADDAVWIADDPSAGLRLYTVSRAQPANATAFRSFATGTLATSSDLVFYGMIYGIGVSKTTTIQLGSSDLAVSTGGSSTATSTAPRAMAVGGGTLAYIGPLAPGAPHAVLATPTTTVNSPPAVTLDTTSPDANAIAVSRDGTTVYWTVPTGEAYAQRADGSRPRSTIASGLAGPRRIAVDGAFVYVLTESELVRFRANGTCRASVPAELPSHLAIGGEWVYVSSGGSIRRTKK